MLKKKFLVLAIIGLFIGAGVIQNITLNVTAHDPPETEWSRVFGGSGYDVGYSVIETSDNSFLLAGLTKSYGNGDSDGWLIKTDSDGNEIWNKTFGGVSQDCFLSIDETSDNGFIIAGSTMSYGAGDNDVWLIKTDSDGNEIWSRTFGGTGYDFASSVKQTIDSGFILTGVKGHAYGSGELWLIKTDDSGIMEWDKTFDAPGQDIGNSVQQTSDGGYIIGGEKGLSATKKDLWVIKTDEHGNELWNVSFDGGGKDVCHSIQETTDGGYIITGIKNSADYLWLIKINDVGVMQWDKTFGVGGKDYGTSVIQTGDGGYIVTGSTGSGDLWIIKTDEDGDESWSKALGEGPIDKGFSIIQTEDSNYIILGFTESYGSGGRDVWLIKLKGEPGSTPVQNPYEIPNKVPVEDRVRFYEGNEPGLSYPSRFVPLTQQDFVNSKMSKEDILYILNIAYQFEKEISGNKYEHDLSNIYIVRDSTWNKNGFFAGWNFDPPVIAIGTERNFIEPDGFSSWPELFHEMGHIFSDNAIGDNGHHLGEISGYTSNILKETTACMYASYVCHELISSYQIYNIPNELKEIFEQQYHEEVYGKNGQGGQEGGYKKYTQGYEYCCGEIWPEKTYFDKFIKRICGSSDNNCDQRALYTQQTADFVYIEKAIEQDDYSSMEEYMEIIKNIKDEEEIDILKYDGDDSEKMELSRRHRASLYVAAVSNGLKLDMRPIYKDLNFPIDDSLFYYYYNDRDIASDRTSWFENPWFKGLEIDERIQNGIIQMEVPGGEDRDWGVHGYIWDEDSWDNDIDECIFRSIKQDENVDMYLYGMENTYAKIPDKYSAVALIQGDIWDSNPDWFCPESLPVSDNEIFIDIWLKKGESVKLCEKAKDGRIMYAINIWLKDSSIEVKNSEDHSNLMVLDLIFYLGENDKPDLFFDNNGFHYQTYVGEILKENEWKEYSFNLNDYIKKAIDKATSGDVDGAIRDYDIEKMTLEQAEILIELVHAKGELTVGGFDLYYYPKIEITEIELEEESNDFFDIPSTSTPGFEILFLLIAIVAVMLIKRRMK